MTTVVGILESDEIVDASQLPELDKAQEIYTVLDKIGFWLLVLWVLGSIARLPRDDLGTPRRLAGQPS